MSFPVAEPDSPLTELCRQLELLAPGLQSERDWPTEQLRKCAEAGLASWFLPAAVGGLGWSDTEVMQAYMQLSSACLTTTFVITQFLGACRRIAGSENWSLRDELLPGLLSGESFATVGISHLTTSSRHLAQPALRAIQDEQGYRLLGKAPWVTGATVADIIVVGATLDDGQELLAVTRRNQLGIKALPPFPLVGLAASQTGPVEYDGYVVDGTDVIAGPIANVMRSGVGAGTGGPQTSALAVGLARAAIVYLEREAEKRSELAEPAAAFRAELDTISLQVLAAADHQSSCSLEELRGHANHLVLRSTQAALAAAKGAGYLTHHPTGRWCREALFFLVWSCPQPVLNATLCELAGLPE